MTSPQRFSRRRALGLGGMATFASAAGLPAGLAAELSGPRGAGKTAGKTAGKKGLGIAARKGAWSKRLASLNCDWFYTWGAERPADTPKGPEFIPMIWGYWGQDDKIAAAGEAARKAGIRELLGFNEPDRHNQSNLSVERALKAWPLLEATGLRLGSPGCVHPDNDWMKTFMRRAKRERLKVDFVCVHNYGGPSADALVKRLTDVYRMYRKPIWITEFAVGDWEAKSAEANRHKPDRILRFMEAVLPRLEQLDFIERYAWFPAAPDNRALGTSALHDSTGKLTRLGECYRDA